ncbi:hypothetical protein KC980_04085 [candidate division WWE3 bacterium]|uniref:Uncharacterized protein n=1 Tax=candidate division WWE3 bacterium TaxID=2053526 RepID=A0A955EDN9_UNCKA|nr:hypothetical protein [candidate division WWE3 bacterium]
MNKVLFSTLFILYLFSGNVVFARDCKIEPQSLKCSWFRQLDIQIITTSTITSLNDLVVEASKPTLLICDTVFTSAEFSCTPTSVFMPHTDQNFTLEDPRVYQVKTDKGFILVAPASSFIEYEKRILTNAYIGYYTFTAYPVPSLPINSLFRQSLKDFLVSENALVFFTSVCIFLAFACSYLFPKLSTLRPKTKHLLYCLLVLPALYIVLITYIDVGNFNIDYSFDFIVRTFSAASWRNYKDSIPLAHIVFVMLLVLPLPLLVFPHYEKIFHDSIQLIKTLTTRTFASKAWHIILLVSLLLCIALLLSYPLKSISLVLAFLFLLIVILLRSYKFQFTRVQKLVFVIFLLCELSYFFLNNKVEKYYVKSSLIGVPDAVVFLPYTKHHTGDTLYEDFMLHSPTTILIDDYLVYHNKYPTIVNLPLSQFTATGAYITPTQSNLDSGDKVLYHYYKSEETPPFTVTNKLDISYNLAPVVNMLQTSNMLKQPFVISSYSEYLPAIRIDSDRL